jgi:hypothetical protein
MPSSGMGESVVTLTSVGGYAGSLGLTCAYNGTPPEGKTAPSCTQRTPPMAIPIAAGQTVTSSVLLLGPGIAIPAAGRAPAHEAARPLLAGLAAGALLLLGLRRRRMGRMLVLAALSLAALGGISACGGSKGNSLSPGVYSYRVIAGDNNQVNVSANFTVTVP